MAYGEQMVKALTDIRDVLAMPAGQNAVSWIYQPVELGLDDRICGVCKKPRLKPFAAHCPNCHAKILWDMA
jgi:hypothetical protein